MSDLKYIRTPRSSTGDGTPVLLAFHFRQEATGPIEAADVAWSQEARRVLDVLTLEARRLDEDRSIRLPTASAVTVLSASIPQVFGIARDLKLDGATIDAPFLRATWREDLAVQAGRALGLWANRILGPWAERRGVADALIADAREVLGSAEAVVVSQRKLSAADDPSAFFDSVRDAIAARLGADLAGKSLFDGLGPVRRVISRARANEVSFETFPQLTDGEPWSMRAVLRIGTDAANRPLVTLGASRRRYLTKLPGRRDLQRSRFLTGIVMSGQSPLAIEFPCAIKDGEVADPTDPALLVEAVKAQIPLHSLEEAIARGSRDGVFLGIPYSTRYSTVETRLGAGVTERDLVDAATAVEAYADTLRRIDVGAAQRRIKRGAGAHRTATLSHVLTDFARDQGANLIDDDALVRACRTIYDADPARRDLGGDVDDALGIMDDVRAINETRIKRAYRGNKPTVVIFARSERERDAAQATVHRLFGDAITIETAALPAGTHGLYTALPGRSLPAKERFALRANAWREDAEALKARFGSWHALVQVSDFATDPSQGDTRARPEDRINKYAGRHALATYGNANVQYLLPPGRDLGSYIYRMQSAMADLLFGHAASVADLQAPVTAAFPNGGARPTCIIGISAIGRARRYRSQNAALLMVATRIDVASGRTTAALARSRNGLLAPIEFKDFFQTLKDVSGLDEEVLSPPHESRPDLFQSFVGTVLRSEVEQGARPLVLIDASFTRSLWPYLRNGNIGTVPMLRGEPVDTTAELPGVRIVRINDDGVPRIILDRTKTAELLDAESGAVEGTIALHTPVAAPDVWEISAEGATPVFVGMGVRDRTNKAKQGLSVYRPTLTGRRVSADELPAALKSTQRVDLLTERTLTNESYRIAGAIEIVPSLLDPTDDPAAVARLVNALRTGYDHTELASSLPAPLFFEKKVREYISLFFLESEADDEQSAFDPDAEEAAPPAPTSDDSAAEAVLERLTAPALAPKERAASADSTALPEHLLRTIAESPAFASLIARLRVPLPSFVTDKWVERWTGLSPHRAGSLKATFIYYGGLVSALTRIDADNFAEGDEISAIRDLMEFPYICKLLLDIDADEELFGPFRALEALYARTTYEVVESAYRSDPSDDLARFFRHGETTDESLTVALLERMWGVEEQDLVDAVTVVTTSLTKVRSFGIDSAYHKLPESSREVAALLDAYAAYPDPTECELVLENAACGAGFDYPTRRGLLRAAALREVKIADLAGRPIPAVPLPHFVTEDWLRERVSLSGRVVSALHAEREMLCRWTGDEKAWPVVKPRDSEVVALLRRLMTHPLGFCALDIVCLTLNHSSEADDSIFKPFVRKVRSILVGLGHHDPGTYGLAKGIDILSGVGHETLARDLAFILGLIRADCRNVAQMLPDAEYTPELKAYFDALEFGRLIAAASWAHTDDNVFARRFGNVRVLQSAHVGVAKHSAPAVPAPVLPNATESPMSHHSTEYFEAGRAFATELKALTDKTPSEVSDRDFANLRDLLANWEASHTTLIASLPKLVDAAPTRERAQTLRGSIVALDEDIGHAQPLAAVPDVAQMTADAAEQAANLLGAGEATMANAKVDLARVLELESTRAGAKLLEKAKIDDEINTLAERLAQHSKEAASRYGAAVDIMAGDEPLARAPEPGPDPELATAVPSQAAPEPAPHPPTTEPISTGLARVEAQSSQADEPPPANLPVPSLVPTPIPVEPAAERLDAADLAHLTDLAEQSTREVDEEVALLEAADREMQREIARVNERILQLAGGRSYGLAYHLAAAAALTYPDATLWATSDELRFAAVAGHLNHAALQSDVALLGFISSIGFKAIATIQDLEHAERRQNRKLRLHPTAVELALFQAASGGELMLDALAEAPEDIGGKVVALNAVVKSISHGRMPLSPAVLRLVSDEMALSSSIQALSSRLATAISEFSARKFRFMLGNRVRVTMLRADMPVGRLREALAAGHDNGLAEAEEFVALTASREKILAALEAAEKDAGLVSGRLDGAARERFIAMMSELRDIAAEFVAVAKARNMLPADEQPKVRKAVSDLRAALNSLITSCEGLAASGEGETGAAASYAAERYKALDATLAGSVEPPHALDHLIAVHGALPFIESFAFGRSWLPVPYDPPAIVDALLSSPFRELSTNRDARAAAFRAAFAKRAASQSFVGAQMLLDGARFFGLPETLIHDLRHELQQDVAAAREALTHEAHKTRELIHRITRMGSTPIEESDRLLSVVDKISEATIPAEISPEERSEGADDERMYDIDLAQRLLEETQYQVRALLDERRNSLLARLDGMADQLAREHVNEIRTLCDQDDLLTAEELINEPPGSIPQRPTLDHRFDRFRRHALPFAAARRREFDQLAADAMARSEDLAGLPYSALSPARREAAIAAFELWRDVFRRLPATVADAQFGARIADLLERIGLHLSFSDVDQVLSRSTRRQFVADFTGTVATDKESLLLPDFGSLTNGNYRVVFASELPADAELDHFCSAGISGVLLFVADAVTPERREQFRLRNVGAGRRILLIDVVAIAFALAEPEMRALTALELAQPYSFAAPYKDWERNAVPREMFVGRASEIAKIVDPNGSCVVYGGRRLGKTALLRHIVERFHAPDNGILVPFVDAQGIGRVVGSARQIWIELAKALQPMLFTRGIPASPKQIQDEIETWLACDGRRRILALLDEADDLVVADAAQGYEEFRGLQRLMTDTKRRFKFVLSGLHNVTRLVQTGNAPIKQISSDPQRIGPLMGAELKDAEDLVLKPFAALGIRFEKRSDIWRILSHANYYPVLVQSYAARLLEMVFEESVKSGRSVSEVSRRHVDAVLEDRKARADVREKFAMTLRIDRRYELIAYAVAMLSLGNDAAGVIEEGFGIREIRDAAVAYWPAGFQEANRFSLFEDLVEEMEGLGILRTTSADRWTLRSTAVLRLLGSRDEMEAHLESFARMNAPREFDPKSARREIEFGRAYDVVGKQASPLTVGQERDILFGPQHATVVLGNELSQPELVVPALRTALADIAADSFDDLIASQAADPAALIQEIRASRSKARAKVLLVVPPTTAWNGKWLTEALRQKAVQDSVVRMVFVGATSHASVLVTDRGFAKPSSRLRTMSLEPWSLSFLDERLKRISVPDDQVVSELLRTFGGWNSPMNKLFMADATRKGTERFSQRVSQVTAELVADPRLAERLGLTGEFQRVCETLLDFTGKQGNISLKTVTEFVEDKEFQALANVGPAFTAESFIQFGTLMGLLEIEQGSAGDPRQSVFRFSPLVSGAIETIRKAAA